jgi:hypothetical protein
LIGGDGFISYSISRGRGGRLVGGTRTSWLEEGCSPDKGGSGDDFLNFGEMGQSLMLGTNEKGSG